MPQLKLPSFLRQLLGALGGALVALMLYEAYSLSTPALTAWLTAPQSQIAAEHPDEVRANRQLDDLKFKRVAARAKEISVRFAAEKGPQAAVLPQGIEVTQPSAQPSGAVASVAAAASASNSSVPVPESVAYVVPSGAEASSSSAAARRVIAPAVREESAAASVVRSDAETTRVAKLANKNLPQSGIGTALVTLAALGATAVVRRRK